MRTTLPRLGRPSMPKGFPGMSQMRRPRSWQEGAPDRAPAPETTQTPPMPPGWDGTLDEWIVHDWLRRNGVPFIYRDPSGPALPGGTSRPPAFTLPDQGLLIEVTPNEGAGPAALRVAALRSGGARVVAVSGWDLQASRDETMRAAVAGVSRST